jgi:RNA polymerase sigma factor (sigma-70 family)
MALISEDNHRCEEIVSESLQELLPRCRAGENDAITELVGRYRSWARHLALANIDDRDLAEDAVQEAFLMALQHLSELREPEAFPGWFRRIISTQVNRIARTRRELPLTDEFEPDSGDLTPGQQILREELRQQVREALRSLPPTERETAEMFYIDDLSCADISGLLQVPSGTVKRRLHDARKQLRSMLLGYVGDQIRHDERGKQ